MAHKKSPQILEKTEMSFSRRTFLKLAGGAGLSAVAAPTLLIPNTLGGAALSPQALIPVNKGQELFK